MAKLSFDEKRLIEEAFQMQGGCVLDFKNNREFREFMSDIVSYDIYTKYPGHSKAKIVRAFINDESDAYVGKLVAQLVKHMYNYGLVNNDNQANVEKLNEFARKRLGCVNETKAKFQQPSDASARKTADYEALKSELIKIHQISSRQERGYAFEKFIKNIFTEFGLNPRASYRAEHDQIDGSFTLDGHTVLVEAKYRGDIIPKNDLVIFNNKLSTKSHFSKGLFLTYSEVDKNAIDEYNNHSSRFVIMTVEELFCICEYNISLENILRKKFRALDEEGVIFKHFSKLQ